MNNDAVELEFLTNIQSTINSLNNLNTQLGQTQAVYNSLRGTNPFGGIAQSAADINRTLLDGSKIYQQVQGTAQAYRAEIQRLITAEKELIKIAAEFSNSADYDEIQKKLATVRQRLGDLKEGYRQVAESSENAGRKVKNSIQDSKTATEHLNDALKNAGALIVSVFAVNKIIDFGKNIFSARSNMEAFSIALETMVQSRVEAQNLEADIIQLATKTPFTLQEIQEQTKKLLAYGIATKDVTRDITTLGNISAGVGKDKLPQLTLAFGQVRAIGRLMGTELRQFTEAGVPLLEELAKQAGKSTAVIQNEMSDGKITFDQVKEALESLTGEGGRFFNLMEKQSTTLEGKWSNLLDSIYQGLNLIGEGFEGTAKNALDWAKNFVEALVGSDSALKRTYHGIQTLVAALVTYKTASLLAATRTRIQAFEEAKLAVAGGTATASQTALAASNRTLFVSTGIAVSGVTGLRGALTALWATMSANPIGAILTLLSIVTTAILGFKTATDEVTSATGENIKKLSEEQTSLNGLVNAIKSTKQGTLERLQLIKRLKEEYPDFLRGIKSEDVANGLLDQRLKQVNASYRDRIYLAELAYKQEQALNERKKQLDKDRELENKIKAQYPELQNVFGLDNLQKAIKNKEASEFERDVVYKTNIKNNYDVYKVDFRVKSGDVSKQLVESNTNRKRIEAEIEYYSKKTAEHQAKTTAEKEKQHKLDEQTVKRLSGRKNLSAKEKELLDLATINETLYKSANPIPTKTALTTDEKNKVNAIKDKSLENYESEHKKLIKLQEEFEKKLTDIQLESQNVRLSNMKKDSKEYIEAKREYDLKLIEEERAKFKEMFDIQNGQTVVDKIDSKGVKTYKNISFSEKLSMDLQKNGISKEEAEKQAKAELDKLFETSTKTIAIRELLAEKQKIVAKKATDELIELAENESEYLLSIRQKSYESEVAMLEAKLKKELRNNKGNQEVEKQLTENYLREIRELKAKYDNDAIKDKEEFVLAEIELLKRETGESQIDFERRVQKKRLEAQIKFAEERLAVETRLYEQLLFLENIKAATLSSKEKEQRQNQIKLMQDQIEAMKGQLSAIPQNSGFLNKDIWDIFGITFNKLNAEKNDAIKGVMNNAVITIKNALSEILDFEIKNSEDRINVFNNLISRRESQFNEELEKQKQGLANSADAKRLEVNSLIKSRDEELEHLKKTRKAKAVIESAEITANQAMTISTMIRAAADVFGGLSKIPLGVGVILGIAAVSSLYAAFASIRAKFQQASQVPKLRKGLHLRKGKTHEQGGMNVVDTQTGETLYNIEKDEFLIGTEPSKKYTQLLHHINDDSFKYLSPHQQRKLLTPLGLNLLENSQKEVNKTYKQRRNFERIIERNTANYVFDKDVKKDLSTIAKNTERLPKRHRTHLGKGIFVIDEAGKVIIEQDIAIKKYYDEL